MHACHLSFDLYSDEDTSRAAAALADRLEVGDTILLSGSVGAGKTHFARHLINEILIVPEDIPSPTFALVQTYETRRGALWHADLYRISSSQEIEELGLLDTFDSAICLIEWPDRLGEMCPRKALNINLKDGAHDGARRMDVSWHDKNWSRKLEGWPAE